MEESEIFREHWREAAACAEPPGTADFFCDPGDVAAVNAAKAVCARCVVAGECLSWAIEANQDEGIWGGHTPRQRRALRRRWLEHRRAS